MHDQHNNNDDINNMTFSVMLLAYDSMGNGKSSSTSTEELLRQFRVAKSQQGSHPRESRDSSESGGTEEILRCLKDLKLRKTEEDRKATPALRGTGKKEIYLLARSWLIRLCRTTGRSWNLYACRCLHS